MSELIDLNEALENLGLEKDEFVELAEDLKTFVDETLPKLKTAVESNDMEQLGQLSHAIKGALLNLRFNTAGKIAFELEKVGKQLSSGDPLPLFSSLSSEISKSFDYLQTL